MFVALAALAFCAAPPLLVATQAPDEPTAHLGLATEHGLEELAAISTAPDSTPRGAISPDAKFAALAVAPAGRDRFRRGELYALELRTHALRLLAQDLDALERPRFTRDGR